MTLKVRKAQAYITQGTRLLVFTQPQYPEAGTQVPSGTVEAGETPAQAVIREAHEETGLSAFTLGLFLGEYERDMCDFDKDEIHHRFVYHLYTTDDVPETWDHVELFASSDPKTRPIFRFKWVNLTDGLPDLIADHGKLLPKLIEQLP